MCECRRFTKKQFLKSRFLNDVSDILTPSNPRGKSFLNYLQRVSTQLEIQDLDLCQLISEAVSLGLVHIDHTSQGINDIQIWLRQACVYIMIGSKAKD